MKRCKHRNKAGFTMIELLVAVAVTGVIAVAAIPAMLGFVRHGNQLNRANAARTIYLAAQNRLTELRITKNLKSALTGIYYSADELDPAMYSHNNVYLALGGAGGHFPAAEIANGNEPYVRYISKRYGETSSADPVISLLSPVILDKEMLNGAILIEYNIRTGIVLSAFYGDTIGEFNYEPTGGDASVYGGRGMDSNAEDYYGEAYDRNQGYYGIGDTGTIAGETAEDIKPMTIDIFDSYVYPLPDDSENKNALYAIISVPSEQLTSAFGGKTRFNLNISGKEAVSGIELGSVAAENFGEAIRGDMIYRYDDLAEPEYARFIWVLDYVGGDTAETAGNYSIGVLYAGILAGDEGRNITAGIENLETGAAAESFTQAHPYFYPETEGIYKSGGYSVTTARHLYNMRYESGGSFTQKDDIVMLLPGGSFNNVTNFMPVGEFTGMYKGGYKDSAGVYRGFKIENLTVNAQESEYAGLFGRVISESGALGLYPRASIAGLTLVNPRVTGMDSTGAVCGFLDGFITGIYISYDSEAAGGEIYGGGYTGGIAGVNYGMITDSVLISPSDNIHIASGGTAGGIAGLTRGTATLRRILFLALAPSGGDYISPIDGQNDGGSYSKLYYLSGTGIRPNDIGGSPAYNTKSIRGGGLGERKGTDELCLDNLGGWELFGVTEDEALRDTNEVYPYPVHSYSSGTRAVYPSWPVVKSAGDIALGNIAYFEQYEDGSAGLWFASGGQGTLRNDLRITEAGYAVIFEKKPAGKDYFFARNGDIPADTAWSGADLVCEMSFIKDDTFAAAWGKGTAWVCKLPNGRLAAIETQSRALQIMHTLNNDANNPDEIGAYLNPLFAKGLYPPSGTAPDPAEFYIRTPWQMRNLNTLIARGNDTDKRFVQEVNLDYTHTGDGVSAANGAMEIWSAAITGEFKGIYDGGGNAVTNARLSGNNSMGLFSVNSGVIRGLTLRDSAVSGSDRTGGFAGVNNGAIEDCALVNTSVTSVNTSGGVTAQNFGGIINTRVELSSIRNAGGNTAGGIAGQNMELGVIENCDVKSTQVTGGVSYCGGVTARNNGAIRKTRTDTVTVTGAGGNNIGGISGSNSETGIIEECLIKNTDISGGVNFVGGAAGQNQGIIRKTGAEQTSVKNNNSASGVGGIAGSNSGTVEDVYFLSILTTEQTPVAENGGGIVGNNNDGGGVSRAFYLAPAPSQVSGNKTTIYPIVRSGVEAGAGEEGETCFYLAGSRYSVDGGRTWHDTHYNRVNLTDSHIVECSGGGAGLITQFIDAEWLDYVYEVTLPNWYQPTQSYPYPAIRGIGLPQAWPITDSPPRPDQADRHDWEETLSTSNRAGNIGFINGEFEFVMMNPNNSSDTYQLTNGTRWSSVLVNPEGPHANDDANRGGTTNNFWRYFNQGWVQGWNTRPIEQSNCNDPDMPNCTGGGASAYSHTGYCNPFWDAIEYQRPNSTGSNGQARTNYKGGSDGVYAELNADVQGTLYQICPTVPGTELYYSFYHARRNHGGGSSSTGTAGVSRMNFYLSGMTESGGDWTYSDNSGRPSIIRPCITPRDNTGTTNTTRNTVVYGTTAATQAETVTVGKVDFYDPQLGGVRNAFLVDVWVSGLGYGITFWVDGDTAPAVGSGSGRIPAAGVAAVSNLPSSLRQAAQTNVIGYWHVAEQSEWKQYYGTYTIPDGQITTEFAFESGSRFKPNEGNYLDGITFQSPGFLSIEKYVGMDGGDVKFVQPNDTLTVTLAVRNWGEVTVNNIEIEDRLSPYNAYFDYDGPVEVKKDGMVISADITEPSESNGQRLNIRIPENLKTGEVLRISFDVTIKHEVVPDVTTLLYYFKNQAVISYSDYEFANGYAGNLGAYQGKVKKNASGPDPVQVFIDPVRLTKTVSPQIGGPFTVTMTIENSLRAGESGDVRRLDTIGLVTDLIPAGFEIIDTGNLPEGAVSKDADGKVIANDDGTTRITIRDANLTETVTELEYTYTLAYTGTGYGVVYTDAGADYKYIYAETGEPLNVMLVFPKPVAGIRARAAESEFEVTEARTYVFDITAGDNLEKRLYDGNYDVTPEVVLFDETKTLAQTNPNGDYQVNREFFTAAVLTSTKQLQFTPKVDEDGKFPSGEYEIYYQIRLSGDRVEADGTLSSIPLSSGLAKITIKVTGNETEDEEEAGESEGEEEDAIAETAESGGGGEITAVEEAEVRAYAEAQEAAARANDEAQEAAAAAYAAAQAHAAAQRASAQAAHAALRETALQEAGGDNQDGSAEVSAFAGHGFSMNAGAAAEPGPERPQTEDMPSVNEGDSQDSGVNESGAGFVNTDAPETEPGLSGEPSGTPEGASSGTPEEASSGTPEGASSGTPEEASSGTPEGASSGTPEGTPSETPEGASSGTPEGTPSETPEGAPSGTPSETPDGTSSGTPDGAPSETPEGTPSGTPGEASSGTPDGTPSGTPGDASGGMEFDSTGGESGDMSGGAPIDGTSSGTDTAGQLAEALSVSAEILLIAALPGTILRRRAKTPRLKAGDKYAKKK